MTAAFTAEFDDTDLPLSLTLNFPGDNTGKSPTVRLRLGRTTNTFLDFDDNTFKTSGWTTKDASLFEVGGGHYVRFLDLTTLTGASFAPGDTLISEYFVDDGGSVKGIASDLIVVSSALERIKDIWRIMGLDSSEPLVITAIDRKSGTKITQTIVVVDNVATVTRTL